MTEPDPREEEARAEAGRPPERTAQPRPDQLSRPEDARPVAGRVTGDRPVAGQPSRTDGTAPRPYEQPFTGQAPAAPYAQPQTGRTEPPARPPVGESDAARPYGQSQAERAYTGRNDGHQEPHRDPQFGAPYVGQGDTRYAGRNDSLPDPQYPGQSSERYDAYGRSTGESAGAEHRYDGAGSPTRPHDTTGERAHDRAERPAAGRADVEPAGPTGTRFRADKVDADMKKAAARAGEAMQSSVGQLFQQATEEMARMVRAEVRTAATEANQRLERKAKTEASVNGGAAVAAGLGAAALLVAVVSLLALVVPLWGASLAAGVVLLGSAAALRANGRKKAENRAPAAGAPATREDIAVRERTHR